MKLAITADTSKVMGRTIHSTMILRKPGSGRAISLRVIGKYGLSLDSILARPQRSHGRSLPMYVADVDQHHASNQGLVGCAAVPPC